MPTRRALAPLALSVLLGACGEARNLGGDGGATAPQDAGLRWPGPSYADVQAIFDARCLACHGGPAPLGGLSLEAPGSWANLVEVPSQFSGAGTVRVVPSDAAASVLVRRLTGDALSLMPLGGPPIPAAELQTVRAWIEQGGARQDLAAVLTGMDPHVGERLEARLEDDSGELRVRVVVDPVPAARFEIFVPRVRPTGSHSLAFWADVDGDGAYDAPPVDSAWRREVPASGAVSFARDAAFADVGPTAPAEPGLDFSLALSGMGPNVGQALAVAVFESSGSPRDLAPVGLYRLGEVPAESFSVAIPGIVEAGEDYVVEIFADANGNGRYDAPPADHAWRVFGSADATGLSVSFARDGSFADVARYPPG